MRLRRAPPQPKKQLKLIPTDFDAFEAVPRKRMTAEDLFGAQCRAAHLPTVTPQLYFAEAIGRRFRFDWAFVDYRLAVEIDGVVVKRIGGQLVVMGGHASIDGIRSNNEKGNAAIGLGWSVLHFLQSDVKPRLAIDTTIHVLATRGWTRTQTN